MWVWFIHKGQWEIVQGSEKPHEHPSTSLKHWIQDQDNAFLYELLQWEDRDFKILYPVLTLVGGSICKVNITIFSFQQVACSTQAFLMKAKIINDQLLLAMNATLSYA